MAARSDQHHPFSAPAANSLEPFVFTDPDLDLDVALSHWAQLPACDIDELCPPSPLSHNCQYRQVNYVQPQWPPSLTCTYTLSPPAAAAASASRVVHIQCLPEHELAHITPSLHAPHADANADSAAIAADIMLAHQLHSADKFESSARILGGQCLSEANHMEDQLPLYPLIKPNGTSSYMGNSLALEDLNHLMKSDLPSLVPAVSPTSGALNTRYNSAGTLESSAMTGSTSFSAAMTSSSSTCYESQLLHLERNRMNGAITLSSMNKNDTKFMEEMSFTDDGSVVTLHVKTENINLHDGFTWRKYGHKDIKKKAFKKSYFRCVRYDKGCKVLKRIQRCSDDQDYIDFTYLGRHNHPP